MNYDFARRMNINVYSTGQYIFRIGKSKRRSAAAEKLLKGVGKVFVDLVKALNKAFLHLFCQVND